MAQKHHPSLEIADIQESLLQLAARRAGASDALGAEVLRLAAALCNAAALPTTGSLRQRDTPDRPTPEALLRWRDACAELLAAIAPAVDGINTALSGELPNTRDDSLTARATELTAQSRSTAEAMSQQCRVLREQTAALLRESSRWGALERELQVKRSRLADHVDRAKAAENALAALDAESSQTVRKIEDLQDRLRLAKRTPEEISRLEVEVGRAEAQHRSLAARLAELEDRHSRLKSQTTELPARIVKTEGLIRDLCNSPEQALAEQIREIWERVKRQHEAQA